MKGVLRSGEAWLLHYNFLKPRAKTPDLPTALQKKCIWDIVSVHLHISHCLKNSIIAEKLSRSLRLHLWLEQKYCNLIGWKTLPQTFSRLVRENAIFQMMWPVGPAEGRRAACCWPQTVGTTLEIFPPRVVPCDQTRSMAPAPTQQLWNLHLRELKYLRVIYFWLFIISGIINAIFWSGNWL